jgi:REP-associated tyrosine transposase
MTTSAQHFDSRDGRSFYHVILSGNRREALFSSVHDRRALNALATEVLQRFDGILHAYCLTANHFRALLQMDSRSIMKALREIAQRYSTHKQLDLKSSRHLFERPYKAERVDSRPEFLRLLRNIHLSPVTANKAITPTDYLWSSHRAYLGYKSVARVSTDFGLSLLHKDTAHARAAYQEWIAAEKDEQGVPAEPIEASKRRRGVIRFRHRARAPARYLSVY